MRRLSQTPTRSSKGVARASRSSLGQLKTLALQRAKTRPIAEYSEEEEEEEGTVHVGQAGQPEQPEEEDDAPASAQRSQTAVHSQPQQQQEDYDDDDDDVVELPPTQAQAVVVDEDEVTKQRIKEMTKLIKLGDQPDIESMLRMKKMEPDAGAESGVSYMDRLEQALNSTSESQAEVLAKMLEEAADRTEDAAESSGMLWRYAMKHEVWKTHRNPGLRSPLAFFQSFTNKEMIYVNVMAHTMTQHHKLHCAKVIAQAWGPDWMTVIPAAWRPATVSKRLAAKVLTSTRQFDDRAEAIRGWVAVAEKRIDYASRRERQRQGLEVQSLAHQILPTDVDACLRELPTSQLGLGDVHAYGELAAPQQVLQIKALKPKKASRSAETVRKGAGSAGSAGKAGSRAGSRADGGTADGGSSKRKRALIRMGLPSGEEDPDPDCEWESIFDTLNHALDAVCEQAADGLDGHCLTTFTRVTQDYRQAVKAGFNRHRQSKRPRQSTLARSLFVSEAEQVGDSEDEEDRSSGRDSEEL